MSLVVALNAIKRDLVSGKGNLVSLTAQPRLSAKKDIYVIGGVKREVFSSWNRCTECPYHSVAKYDTFTKWVSLKFSMFFFFFSVYHGWWKFWKVALFILKWRLNLKAKFIQLIIWKKCVSQSSSKITFVFSLFLFASLNDLIKIYFSKNQPKQKQPMYYQTYRVIQKSCITRARLHPCNFWTNWDIDLEFCECC